MRARNALVTKLSHAARTIEAARSCALERTTNDRAAEKSNSVKEVIGLFPTPLMRVPGALTRELVAGLVAHFSKSAGTANNSSANLVHTAMLRPEDSPLLVDAARAITPL